MPHKKTKKHRRGRKTRRMHGGTHYGFKGSLATGAPNWGAGEEIKAPSYAGGRRHKRKKTHKRMRGGTKYGGVSATFGGDGVAGLANYKGASTRVSGPNDVATFGKFNNYGAGPGDKSGFHGLLPK